MMLTCIPTDEHEKRTARILLLEALLRESVPFIESTVSGIEDGEAVALLMAIERALPA